MVILWLEISALHFLPLSVNLGLDGALHFILNLGVISFHLSVVVTGCSVFLPVSRSSPVVDGRQAAQAANHPTAVMKNHVLGRPLHQLLGIVGEVEVLLVWTTLLVEHPEGLISRPHVQIRLVLALLLVVIVNGIHV